MAEGVRIHKALADAGVASRRGAEALVAEGRVAVNGVTARIGQRVDPAADRLTVDGRAVGAAPEPVYLVLAKPGGVTSTVSDRHAEQTVVDLVPVELRRRAVRIFPVGRLDRDSEGLLLLTNDGEWAQRMLHPRHGVEREYAVGLARPLNTDQHRSLEKGVELEEGTATLANLQLSTGPEVHRLAGLLGRDVEGLTWYRATLRQGWRRQLRRMFAAVGAPVERLVRVRFGTLRLGDMALGEIRELSGRERRQLEGLAGAARGSTAGDHPASEAEVESLDGELPAAETPHVTHGLVVSLDGPGSSGKSSVGSRAARELGYRFCDTGVLYRGLTWLAVERKVDPMDVPRLVDLVRLVELAPDAEGRYVRLLAGGREVTDQLHTSAVDRDVSRVSQHADVRAALLPLQRGLASGGGLIMAGRDSGTVVLPDADPKLYLEVSIEERARRRAFERGIVDDPAALSSIEAELRRRDGVDSTRQTAPLRVPEGATVIHSGGNTLDQTVGAVVATIERRARELREAAR